LSQYGSIKETHPNPPLGKRRGSDSPLSTGGLRGGLFREVRENQTVLVVE